MKSPCVSCANTEDRGECSKTCEALALYRETVVFEESDLISPLSVEPSPYLHMGKSFYIPPYTKRILGGYRKRSFDGAS